MSDCNCSICKEMENYINTETKTDCECPICFETISSEVNTVITECGHRFHCKCLMQNAMHNGFGCPYCRTDMTNKPKPEKIHVIEQEYEYINDAEDMELEEGEIFRTEFQEFVDRQFYIDKIHGKHFVLTTFRMFQQRIEGEEPEEYTEEELDDLEANTESQSFTRNLNEANNIIQSILNKNISKEELIRCMLYGSFGHEIHQEIYFKVFGKVKASILGKARHAQQNRPIQIHY